MKENGERKKLKKRRKKSEKGKDVNGDVGVNTGSETRMIPGDRKNPRG